jgi:hypothetical protein
VGLGVVAVVIVIVAMAVVVAQIGLVARRVVVQLLDLETAAASAGCPTMIASCTSYSPDACTLTFKNKKG